MTGSLKQHTFIGEYFISEELCNELVEFFEESSNMHTPGNIGIGVVDVTKKDSTDITLDNGDEFFYKYFAELVPHVRNYCEKYDILKSENPMAYLEPTNLQRYLPNQGYFAQHYERGAVNARTATRELVFMTYLNTIQDFSDNQGATVFPFQNSFIRPIIGKTLIWPAGFTHKHYGIAHKTETKYIATGWKHLRL